MSIKIEKYLKIESLIILTGNLTILEPPFFKTFLNDLQR